ncbi:hypothetical protein [Marinifilum breve]|uniref:hypothetical protein n=1 Tax=Marinifilum breve TaxID=2184082 RepID=UPI001057DEF8|nr:hypothetical protein [Marinifilum breve]
MICFKEINQSLMTSSYLLFRILYCYCQSSSKQEFGTKVNYFELTRKKKGVNPKYWGVKDYKNGMNGIQAINYFAKTKARLQ